MNSAIFQKHTEYKWQEATKMTIRFPLTVFTSSNIKNTIMVDRINADLRVKTPLRIRFIKRNGRYELSFKRDALFIFVSEDTQEDMVREFKEELADSWDYYAMESDENLTENSKRIKRWLLRNIVEG